MEAAGRRELDVDALGDRGEHAAASLSGSTATIGRPTSPPSRSAGTQRDLAEQRDVEQLGQLLRRRRAPNSS